MLRNINIIGQCFCNAHTGELTNEGVKQLYRILAPLQGHIAGEENVLLIGANIPGVEKSMEFLAKETSLIPMMNSALGNGTRPEISSLYSFLCQKAEEKDTDTAVIVMSHDCGYELARTIAEREDKSFLPDCLPKNETFTYGSYLSMDLDKQQVFLYGSEK